MNFNLKIKELDVLGEIIKSNRRGISLEVLSNGNLTVRATKSLNKKQILDIIKNNDQWIYDKVKSIKEKNEIFIKREYKSNDLLLFLGEYYKLKLVKTSLPIEVDIDYKLKIITVYIEGNNKKEVVKDKLEKYYKKFATQYLKDRVEFYSLKFKEKPREIKIKEQKRRWGSCSGDNRIFFNWKIIMANKDIIDYLIVHEMSHMKEKNHSKNFWNTVQEVLPNYKESKSWLKENGITLQL